MLIMWRTSRVRDHCRRGTRTRGNSAASAQAPCTPTMRRRGHQVWMCSMRHRCSMGTQIPAADRLRTGVALLLHRRGTRLGCQSGGIRRCTSRRGRSAQHRPSARCARRCHRCRRTNMKRQTTTNRLIRTLRRRIISAMNARRRICPRTRDTRRSGGTISTDPVRVRRRSC